MTEQQEPGRICDCHIHSFARHDTPVRGAYAPPQKDIQDYGLEARPLGIVRAIIVQASVDGTDNSRLVSVLENQSQLELRGVGMIDPDTADLDSFHSAGMRAIRIQDRARLGLSALDTLPTLARLAASFNWHIELNTEPKSFCDIAIALPNLPENTLLVLDHIGHVDPEKPEDVESLLRLLDTGQVWVKLSLTRVSKRVGVYTDLVPLISRICTNYPQQCIWGSDWPHVITQPPLPEIAPMLALFREVLSPEQFKACMWFNPEKLYGF
ncbi:MAG: 2-pyrone-4,6-dicarboxylate hydrolase [Hyphomicrobiales bacterium]|nr:MAG: 2-pyrone-4,6-dicarboxylate hydrolase [Hyphomicrobiales bacterium]